MRRQTPCAMLVPPADEKPARRFLPARLCLPARPFSSPAPGKGTGMAEMENSIKSISAPQRENSEPVFIAGGHRASGDVFCRTGRSFAARGNPDGLQRKLARHGGKKTVQTAIKGCMNTGS